MERETDVRELSVRAVLLGVVMAACMGAANAYLGLKAGMTIAATYTTAVVGMAVIKALKGTLLEENCARTIGSIGGNIATGAIFTLPAFFIAGIWLPFSTMAHGVVATVMLAAGGVLGIMFVTVTRRVLVNNAELPFPESVAAAQIHKAGQRGAGGASALLSGMAAGGLFAILTELKALAAKWQAALPLGKGALLVRGPEMSPAFFGVGYIIGPTLAGINFSGGVLAWGLLTPTLALLLHYNDPVPPANWAEAMVAVWKTHVRYIAIGGMLVGAFYTLFRMRKSLFEGVTRSLSALRASGPALERTDRDISPRWALPAIGIIALLVGTVFYSLSGNLAAAIVAAVLMVSLGFVFAAVSGYLVGVIGVSSNPTSGLTVAVLIAVATVLVLMGLSGPTGVAAVLGVAAFTCVSVSVAGEIVQDLKAGQILGGTPWRMQLGDLFGVAAASAIMFAVLSVLHIGDLKQGVAEKLASLESVRSVTWTRPGGPPVSYSLDEVRKLPLEQQNEVLGANRGFGGDKIPAPQASLMAVVARGMMERRTEWILLVSGMLMGIAFILMGVKSPMLVSVGMYLPIETSFAIFIGGAFKGLTDALVARRALDESAREQVSSRGTLLASGLIAGEALIGILFAALAFADVPLPKLFAAPPYAASLVGMALIGAGLVAFSLRRRQTLDNGAD